MISIYLNQKVDFTEIQFTQCIQFEESDKCMHLWKCHITNKSATFPSPPKVLSCPPQLIPTLRGNHCSDFYILELNRIMQYVFFCVRHFLPHIMALRFIHGVAYIGRFFFPYCWMVSQCMDILHLFIHPPMNGYMGYFLL